LKIKLFLTLLNSGFDSNGRLYDEFGVKRDWWSEKSSLQYNEKCKCFVDQYSKIQINGSFFDGAHTLNENIADNVGLFCKIYSTFSF
jgi:endothelin-converting enzyme